MCLPFFHKYKIVGGWHGTSLLGGNGTCIEKVCKICGHYATQTVPGYVDTSDIKDKLREEND